MAHKYVSVSWIWLFILSIWLVILTICMFVRVEPLIVWSSETYMGIFVAFIGIATALIIGYQVVNAIDVKSDLRSMRADIDSQMASWKDAVTELDVKHSDLSNNVDTIYASVREGIAILDALRISGEGGNISRNLDVFCKMHEALLYSLEYDSTNYEFILSKLTEFGKRICTQSFGPGFAKTKDGFFYATPNLPYYKRKLTDVVEEVILPPIKEIESKIKDHKNFTGISFYYNDLMRRFYNRVEISTTRFFPQNLDEFNDF